MEEDLKRLIKKCDECKLNECINCEISYSDIQTIKHLIKAYKELKEIEESHRKENGELREKVKQMEEENETAKTITSQLMSDFINRNVIPVSLVKEKIEESKKYIYKGKNAPQDFLQYRVKAKIQAYEELLEKRK